MTDASREMRFARATVPLLCYLAFAACGSAPSSARLSTAGLVRDASAICDRAAGEERDLGAGAPGTLAQRVARLERVGTREIDDLRALRPPASESAAYRAFLAQGERLVQLAVRLGRTRAPAVKREVLAEGRAGAARLLMLAQQLGLTSCSTATS